MSDENRARTAIDRIQAAGKILDILVRYGYGVRADGGHREQQFSCDLHGDGWDSKPSARIYPESNSWYCVGVHERVLTSWGWVPLGDLHRTLQCRSGPKAGAVFGLAPLTVHDGVGQWARPLRYIWRGPERELVCVKTKAGYQVKVTPDHRIEVVGRGWVQAQEIHPGDVLIVPKPTIPSFSLQKNLPVGDLNERTYGRYPKLSLPTSWSQEVGEVLGYVFGDGWVIPRPDPASGQVGLTAHASDVEDARKVFAELRRWGSGRGSEAHCTQVTQINGREYVQDQYVFTLGNDGLVEFLQRLGLDKSKPANERSMPESIWQAPVEGVRGFLRGVFAADGSVFRPTGRKGIKVNLYSVSGQFLHDIQLILLQFGIHCRVYPPSRTKKAGKWTHPCWYLQLATGKDILSFRDQIGLASTRKQQVLDSFRYDPRGSRPFKPVVVSVEPAGKGSVADLSMPREHSFVAGGIKVHNCFTCDRTRDLVSTVQAKEDWSFWKAVAMLEKLYGLEPLPWEKDHSNLLDDVVEGFHRHRTWDQEVERCRSFLTGMRDTLTLAQMLSFWDGFDKVVFFVHKKVWAEPKGRVMFDAIRKRVVDTIKDENKKVRD